MTEPALTGIHHITLNVHDPDLSEQWYHDVLGFSRTTEFNTPGFRRVIMRHPSGLVLGLTRHHDPEADVRFSERRTGLDHLAIQVPGRGQLEAWHARFEDLGVTHSEIKPGALPGSFLIAFRDPDDIQLEVFAPAQDSSG